MSFFVGPRKKQRPMEYHSGRSLRRRSGLISSGIAGGPAISCTGEQSKEERFQEYGWMIETLSSNPRPLGPFPF